LIERTEAEEAMKKILVIEDEQDFARLVKIRLEAAGYEAVHASDGMSGFEASARVSPDLIMLDLMLPNGDGLSVLRKIRRSPETKNIPVIVVTAKQDPVYKGLVLDEGVSSYFQKPCDMADIIKEIKKNVPV
jgi:DNA-binding response OmpR family regulator